MFTVPTGLDILIYLAFPIGVILLICAVVRFIQWRAVFGELKTITATETSTVAELKEVIEAITSCLGNADIFRQQVEVKGLIHCSEPMIAELSAKPCVYARSLYEEKFEETYTYEGKTKTRQDSQDSVVLADNTCSVIFQLEDDTGSITINPVGANVEAIEVVNRYEANKNAEKLGNKRSLGHQYNEWILPVGQRIYVLGEISISNDHVVIEKPLQEAYPFLITHRLEDQIVGAKRVKARRHLIDSIIYLIVGVLITFVSMVVFHN
ncbi:MAG: hypothetical protein F6K19_49895 [Cyanothece sp. SIO1E1]|nr:hypothetical protein [Cyanothece sp. SIO1E1]